MVGREPLTRRASQAVQTSFSLIPRGIPLVSVFCALQPPTLVTIIDTYRDLYDMFCVPHTT